MELLNLDPDWKKIWKASGMPDFHMEDLTDWAKLTVCFANREDREEFLMKIDPELTLSSKWTWFPAQDYNKYSERPESPIDTKPQKYPIYIISKGRWDNSMTAEYLRLLSIKCYLVVEAAELKHYTKLVRPGLKILVLPDAVAGSGCSIPARNFVWDHAQKSGSGRHWILDDNIQGFYCMNNNEKHLVHENPFIPVEQFSDHFDNVGISGMNYEFMLQHRVAYAPYQLNTRVYSCILLRNDLPFRWRGRYNEDTDLCIRTLKSGECTVLFNYMQAKKVPTMSIGGGNTDSLYQADGRKEMALSLKRQHPDIVTVTRKWGRWQHHVDYSGFTQRLRIRSPR